MIEALAWKNDCLELLDQTQLPERTEFLHLRTSEQVFEAIQSLRVRGAPAIGIAAAYGLYLGVRGVTTDSPAEFFRAVDAQVAFLSKARPTAVNLVWALQELRAQLATLSEADVPTLQRRLLELALALHTDDRQRCQRMAEQGQRLVPDGARILTHCNTGALATGGIGTALGVIHHAHALGKRLHVYADETRPVLQGARLTMWELAAAGIPAHLVCDNAAAWLMREGKVDLVLLGADRIAADGSVANKIGTYGLAVLARHHGVPFYVAAPLSTFDRHLASGREIPIEQRSEEEVRRVFGKTLITLPDAACCNPAFDVTPPELITAIITERGVIESPSTARLATLFAGIDSAA